MAKKSSNKTAHVLNLLTSGARDEALDAEKQDDGVPVAKPLPVKKKAVPADAANRLLKTLKTPSATSRAYAPAAAPIEPHRVSPPPAEGEPLTQRDTPTEQPAPVPTVTSLTQENITPQTEPREAARQSAAPEPVEPVSDTPKSGYDLINLAELAITQNIDTIIARMNVCTCTECRKDVAALALNTLPARYLTGGAQSQELSRYLAEFGAQVTASLVKACIKVKTADRHEPHKP